MGNMKKWIRILVAALSVCLILIVFSGLFIYFSVDSRVEIDNTDVTFKNSGMISRLDSTTVSVDSVSNYVNALIKTANVQGLAISIINSNKLVYQGYFGKRNIQQNESFQPGCVWYGASLSKTIFADIVLQLAEDNIIGLDSPVYKYLRKPLYAYTTNPLETFLGSNYFDYSDLEKDPRYKRITPRMCLNHTTGFPNWRWLEEDGRLKIKSEPGLAYRYSGEGMFLLQFVIEELTGKSLEQIAFEKVFERRGMTRSSYVWQRNYEGNYAVGHDKYGNNLRIPKTNSPNAAGSLSTSLEDYTKFFIAVLKQEEQRYKDMLTSQVRIKSKQQFGPNASIETEENEPINLSYGLGVGLYQTPYGKAFFKEGHLEGWQHYAVGFADAGTGLIMMANSDQAESIFKELIEFTIGNHYTPWFWEGYIPYDGDMK